ncbi:MAG: transglutaminase family protein [Isosphaeraceae bacterium]|nr:transglutaminase family protein [Isosphaeraceae bacterium]
MGIRVALNHKTSYCYDRLVNLSPQVVRLRPAPHARTPILSYSLKVSPKEHFLNWQQDPYSNYLGRLVFPKPTKEFTVEVDLVADMTVINPFDFFVEASAEEYPFAYEPVIAKELVPYLETLPPGPKLRQLVEALRIEKIRTTDYLVEINRRVHELVRYLIRMEPGVQTCEETLTLGSGSCRDSAWLSVQAMRHLGIAARFVSGYLIQLAPDVKSLDGPSGPEQDFTDLHAWAEAYIPGAGWVGLDATSGLLAGEGHIPLACTADPQSAAPITGSFAWAEGPDHGEPEFHVSMAVTRCHEDPRVTKPYTEAQWEAIDALGRAIDARLHAADVRLTMGGEPTFVSVDDRDGDEWNTAALGPNKRRLAGQLLTRLRDRFAPGALLHHGQGKWYPGEPLPRWALGCYWRRDGVPIWEDPSLYADESRNYQHGPGDAHQFAFELSDRLGVDAAHCEPGYEDAWYYLWRERRLPSNVDPLRNKLEDPLERKRLARIFEDGLGRVVGYALPLRKEHDGDGSRWVTGPWFLRREHLFLLPGDSPMGLRLPLDSLPWAVPGDIEAAHDLDPFAPRAPLPARTELIRQSRDRTPLGPGEGHGEVVTDRSAPGIVRTALCVEPRDGRLHIFMPPLVYLEDYLELVAKLEATASQLGLPIVIEGYTPPSDHRLHHLSVTPDPGVIEVNLHPAHNWEELAQATSVLYEEAHQTRLSTEKFMIDGRHVGTGGGNHIVLGGPTPADSPVLRRPDLLRSLVAYWHNHPSLSYLFSGLFVGPTSQAPRIDEARNDSLYEMEVAFRQIPDHGGCPPWLVDRVFRNLLVDVTGNTHRAEFCIDKLYSPDTSSGRRGLVEMRAFEMPPHPRMSLVQQLLIRALIARFWEAPYNARLVRWGTELHDKFLLPHFVDQDFQDVIEELQRAGLPLQGDWFAPHFEFRYPAYGHYRQRGVDVELRQAIEPWHVLGEEPAGGAAARFVDSSVERLQVKVRGMTDDRHVVACNGRRLPLHPTGTNGEYVAGVRYRAWQPPACLHPTIGVHAPLTFDVVDTWLGRSLGGFMYHVAHPGGLSYERFPINAYEAESRRTSRFTPFGHTPGKLVAAEELRDPDAPLTLDLRRPSRPWGLGL